MLLEQTQSIKNKDISSYNICINERYVIKSAVGQYGSYSLFQGIDRIKLKWVSIYAKQGQTQEKLTAAVKDTVKNQICPKILWSGTLDSPKSNTYFQVHEKYGPSLNSVFEIMKKAPSEKQLLHMLYEMIRLIEKMSNVNLACGELDSDYIIFDPSPAKTDLYLLNIFRLKKKNQNSRVVKSRFSSRGAHLGRNITIKDDLESICYIMMDIFLNGTFLSDKRPSEFEQTKLSTKLNDLAPGLPQVIQDFYYYVVSLNINDEINFFYWKSVLSKILTSQVISQPFTFLPAKRPSKDNTKNQKDATLSELSLAVGNNDDNPQNEEDLFQFEQHPENEQENRIDKIKYLQVIARHQRKEDDCS